MSEFYVTLPSNTHVGNKTGDFRVHLPDIIKLEGEWDVALAQIQYPKSWNNISDDSDERVGFQQNKIIVTMAADRMRLPVEIPTGHYETIDDLLATIVYSIQLKAQEARDRLKPVLETDGEREKFAKVLEDLNNVHARISWTFNPIIKRVQLKFDRQLVHNIRMSRHLQYVMGFQFGDTKNFFGEKIISKYPVDVRAGLDALYVYCDLVENQIVGNVRAPLLKILPVQGIHGEIINQDFVARHYVPVLSKELQTIRISIKSDSDKMIPFEFGKVIVKLHFKRRENAYGVRAW